MHAVASLQAGPGVLALQLTSRRQESVLLEKNGYSGGGPFRHDTLLRALLLCSPNSSPWEFPSLQA